MADTKISDETAAGALDGTEIVPVVKAGANRRTTAQDIADLGGGGAGSLELISTLTANNTATSLAWTGLSGDDYLMIVRALLPATNGADILLQFGTGATPTWITSADYAWSRNFWLESTGGTGTQNGPTAGVQLANAVDNSGGGFLDGKVDLFGLSTAIRHAVIFGGHRMNASVLAWLWGTGTCAGTTPKTAVRLITSAGNLFSGSASLYRYVP